MKNILNNNWFYIIVLFLVSIYFQLNILYQFEKHPLFNYINQVTDSYLFFESGKKIAENNFFGTGNFIQTPGYNYFLGIIIKFFSKKLFVIRLFQILIGSINIILIYLLSNIIFKNKLAAFTSGILLCFCGIYYYYHQLILRPFLVSFFLNLSILLLLLAFKTKKNTHFFTAGIISGLGFLIRPNIISVILAPLYKFFNNKKKIISFILGIFIIFLFLVLRNYVADADLFNVSSKGPLEFASGNIPGTTGVGWQQNDVINKFTGKYSSLSSIIFGVYKQRLFSEPINFILLQHNKLMAILNNYEIPNNYNFYYYKEEIIPILNYFPVTFGIILILGGIGIYFSFRNLNKNFDEYNKLYLINLILFILSVAFFYVISRFRFPVLSLLSVYTGYGIYNIFKIRNFRDSIIVFLITVSLFLISYHYPVKGYQKSYNMALAYANDASAFLKQNNKSKAIELYKTALSHYPALPGFKTILRLFFETKNYEEMENYAQWCSRQYPNANFQYYYLSLSHIIKKDYKTAIPYLLKLNNTMAVYKFYNLALSYFYLNDYKKSLFYWKKYHEVNPKDLNAKKNIKNLENYFQKSNSKK